jgi:hypothetical protein
VTSVNLTGDLFFNTLLAATCVIVLGTILLWTRVRGVPILRFLQRLMLVGLCQLAAVAVAGTWVNNHYGLYASWSDLLGTDNQGSLVMAGPPPKVAAFTPSLGGTVSTFFRGPQSRLAGEVYVWKPPQYDEPAYKRTRFPVIELLHGIPGEPRDWMMRGGMPGTLARLMAEHRLKPALLVMPEIAPGGADTDCSNTGKVRGATWLAKDVTGLIKHRFRTLSDPKSWALVGISTGGFCAIKLPMQYPKIFGIGAGMDADPFAGDPTVLTDRALRTANAPLTLARSRPPVHLFAATSAQDSWSPPSNITALADVVRPPTVLAPAYILQDGGHNWHTWTRMEPALFTWLNGVLAGPEQAAKGR